MPHFPTELLLDILDRSHFNKTAFPDYGTLCSLSLVCRALGWPAQSALFRFVNLSRRKQAQSFIWATHPGTEKGRSLGSAVRFLTTKVEEEANLTKNQIGFPSFVIIFLQCTKLQGLTLRNLGGHSSHPFSTTEENLMASGAPKTLRSITAPDFRFAFALMKVCPWVTSLCLGGEELPTRSDVRTLETASLLEIQWHGELHLLGWALGVGRDRPALDYPSTEILGLRSMRQKDIAPASKILQELGPNLRSLRLKRCPPTLADTIRLHVRKLEEFILDEIPTETVLDALPRATMEHIEVRPAIERFSVQYYDAKPLWKWIKLTSNLKVVTWNVSYSNKDVHNKLQEACDEVGAQLWIYSGHFGRFTGEQERLALSRVESFPRPIDLSPLRTRAKRMCYSAEEFRLKVLNESPDSLTEQTHSPGKTFQGVSPVSRTFLPDDASATFTFKFAPGINVPATLHE